MRYKEMKIGKLIVALDVDNEKKALKIVDELKGVVRLFKVGSELFTSYGPGVIDRINKKGARVFLDLKFHDIPNTVARSALGALKAGVFMFNVHALGGYDMMKKTIESVRGLSKRLRIERPRVIAVTVLTSMDQNGLKKVGLSGNMKTQVLKLAMLAKEAGLDGVVASVREVEYIRKRLGKNFLVVTPGIRPACPQGHSQQSGRPAWAALGDQKRIATPREAVSKGADFIVVGRPIIEAPSPVLAARNILEEMEL